MDRTFSDRGGDPPYTTYVVMALYSCLLLAILPIQSLWLDELIEAVATRSGTIRDLVNGYVAHSAGQSPLGAIEQLFAVRAFGFSNFSLRLPAALASILSCVGMIPLARWGGVRKLWLCIAIFASFPLQFRYGAEGRPYSQALLIAVWLTVVFTRIFDTNKARYSLAYLVLLTLGIYTQPYVVFTAIAHVAFGAFARQRRAILVVGLSIVLSGLVYLPWYLSSKQNWQSEVNSEQLHFHFQAKLPLVIARELLGTGYAGTIVACVLAAFALRSLKSAKGADAHRQTGKVLVSPLGGALGTGPVLREVLGSARDRKMLWVLLALVPIPLVVAADATLDYFFAIRQLIVVLPAVAILVSLGIESAGGRFGIRNGSLIAAALLVLNVAYSVSWLRKPREDWQAAAQLLNDGVARGGCAVFLPAATASYYALFRSDLTAHTCDDRILQEARYVLVAVSPYLRDSTVEKNELDHLARQGWVVSSRTANSKPEVVFLSRANH